MKVIYICLIIHIINPIILLAQNSYGHFPKDTLTFPVYRLKAESNVIVNEKMLYQKKYLLLFLRGNNKILVNTISEHEITSFLINPLYDNSGPGFNFSFIKERNGYNDGMLFFQPFFKIGKEVLYARIGLNIYYELEPEGGPGGMILPHAELGLGKLKRMYLSANILSDVFFGMGSINLNYIFRDKLSSVMIGYAYGDSGKSNGYIYKIDYKFWKNILVRIWGISNFSKQLHGLQIGIGIAL